jgi:single-strand DNA-binding protein
MPSYDYTTIMGNLTADPELRFTPKTGMAVCTFRLAVNYRRKNEAGEPVERATFIPVRAWGKRGETIAKFLKKGDPLHVTGHHSVDEWEDKTTGQKRSRMWINADGFQFIGSKRGDSVAESAAAAVQTEPQPAADNFDEDVPF